MKSLHKWDWYNCECACFQEFGDSARARKLYAAESDDEEEEELEPNPKLAGGTASFYTMHT